MEPSPSSRRDLERAIRYTRLPDHASPADSQPDHRPIIRGPAGICLSMMLVSSVVLLIFSRDEPPRAPAEVDAYQPRSSPGKFMPPSQRVWKKTFRDFSADGPDYPWTNAMLMWQRTAYHFQPEKNWMNDPNGPLFHRGWYHLFYQYNPYSAVWGNMSWGHAVSRDLIQWLYLPLAMVPDHWYDINGVWTGSATLLPDSQIVMLYTGVTDRTVEVQNLAYPANISDPLLLRWVKYENNPVMTPPSSINFSDFRDPTTAWLARDGKWRLAIGSKINGTGIAMVYQSTNFTTYELSEEGVMHAVPGTGMWECVDFYPISTSDSNGLDTSYNGPSTKHVLKVSLSIYMKDFYAIGTYDPNTNTWTPDNPDLDVGNGLLVDYGMYYASKTFYDQNKKRRILWGWIGETDSEDADLMKGWASVQTIPRTVVYDKKTGTNIIQWPIQELERLRLNSTEFHGVELGPGTVVPLNITSATQLDITATFEVEKAALEETQETDVGYNCSTSTGAVLRGALGPFGLLVIADASLTELTPVYFYIAKDNIDGTDHKTFFCSDEMRSSMAADVNKKVYGGMVPVLDGENLSMRILVDHSVVESFAQGGRTVVTSRIYPTKAIYGAAQVYLFNNATGVKVTASVKIWEMDSAHIHHFPSDHDL